MANLKFIRACRLLGLQVTGDWPSSFEPEQVAKMQYPDSGSQSQMLCEALISACKDGTLNNTASVELRQRQRAPMPPGSSTAELLRDALRDNSYEASIYRITAIDLKSWFVEQDEQPAKHLTDWFASVIPACDSEVASLTVVMETKSDDRTPLPMNQVANCFAGFHTNPVWEVPQWKNALGSPDKWLVACRHARGTPGRGGSESTWWPLEIAAALIKMDGNSERSLRSLFKKSKPLEPWFEQFQINHPQD